MGSVEGVKGAEVGIGVGKDLERICCKDTLDGVAPGGGGDEVVPLYCIGLIEVACKANKFTFRGDVIHPFLNKCVCTRERGVVGEMANPQAPMIMGFVTGFTKEKASAVVGSQHVWEY
jgi:hypothetical protein